MKNTIHPKTGGAAIGGALGVLLVAIANSIHGVNLPQGVTDAIAAFLPIAGAYLTPAPADSVPAAQGSSSGAPVDAPGLESWAAANELGWPDEPAPAPIASTEPPSMAGGTEAPPPLPAELPPT